ncbi:MAG: DUF4493 domain-containing protein [Alistipes sp.]|nr:DUF4493 domain-containing protein [Alistipes sp.]
MRKILNFIVCASFALLSAACSNQAEQSLDMAENEGVLALNIDLENTRAQIDPTAEFELKIYRYAADQNKELVRKYTSITEIPQYIWLIKDNYCAQVKVGTKTLASFTDKYYTGTKDFTITAGSVENVTVECEMVNIPVAVAYDTTVAAHFTGEYYTYVSASNSLDLEATKAGKVPTLKYTDSAEGYFILPDGTTNLSWYFYGTDGQTPVTTSGVIENVEAQKLYTLKFKYSKDAPGGLTIVATVDTTVEHRDDKVAFSPDPTVKGVGFDVKTPYNYSSGTRTYTVVALDTINTLSITYGDSTFDLLGNTYDGIAVTKVSAKEYSVALSEQFFANLYGGTQTIAFRIKDASGGVGYQECVYNIQGILPINAYDLWFNTADFSAHSFSGDVTIGYRIDSGEWKQLTVSTAGAANTYNATATDFAAGKNYEYALFAAGVQVGRSLKVTTPSGSQIPESGFEVWTTASDEASCPAADPNALFWDTGNHATAGLVGSQLTVGSTDVREGATGTMSAYMKSIKASVMGIGKFAAGNLFVGRFVAIDGMGGIVEFGRSFDFTARPKALRFWMKNHQGTINEGSHTSGTDLAKVYCCFTDRKFTVNTNKQETFFTPDLNTEGILAKAYWESTEDHNEWTLMELPIEYKEGVTAKPTLLIITFSCSGYGDYFTGSTDSYMYVDDVEFVY